MVTQMQPYYNKCTMFSCVLEGLFWNQTLKIYILYLRPVFINCEVNGVHGGEHMSAVKKNNNMMSEALRCSRSVLHRFMYMILFYCFVLNHRKHTEQCVKAHIAG